MRSFSFEHLWAITVLVAVTACGDNGNSPVSIGGTVTGLQGTGLVLSNNGNDQLEIQSNGSFQFSTPLAFGDEFAVTVSAQPSSPTQTCTVTNGTGRVESTAAISDVAIVCETSSFIVGGTVTGLTGSGLVLQNNGGDDLAITADGSFGFDTSVASGSSFAVTVKAQPTGPSQTCVVSGATGTVGAGPVMTVVVNCAVDHFTVGGTIAGLAGTVVLQNNAGDDITVTANGSFAFPTTVMSGATYDVAVVTQPGVPSQTCVVTDGSGTVTNADVTSVSVDCTTNTFTIGGVVTGLAGSGLMLRNNGGDDLPIASDGTFTFSAPIASGATYAVSIASQPADPTQTCVLSGESGTVGGGNVTSVTVNCTTNRYTVGGTISGLVGTVVLQNNGTDDVPLSANGSFAFPSTIASGDAYAVTVAVQPTNPWQTCAVTAGSGTVTNADIAVSITCTTNQYTIGGTVTGLVSGKSIVLRNNGTDDQTITANGSFVFSTSVPSGQMYAVTIASQSTGQVCSVTSGTGTVANANINTVSVSCAAGVDAFGEFRPALKCEDFVNNGNNTQQWCFDLKGQTLCMGAWANDGACTNTANGIRINTSTTTQWPLRFNPNVDSCLNYNPDPSYVLNLANALGYVNYTIHLAQTGNTCDLSWIDANGTYTSVPGSGDQNLAEIYDISFF